MKGPRRGFSTTPRRPSTTRAPTSRRSHVPVADYRKYYDRTSLDLGDSGANGALETPARLKSWKPGHNISGDPELLALAFNMGKYLLIQSSRPGTLLANL